MWFVRMWDRQRWQGVVCWEGRPEVKLIGKPHAVASMEVLVFVNRVKAGFKTGLS